MCDDAVQRSPFYLEYVSNHLRTQEMREEVVDIEPWSLKYVPDHLKTLRMCDKAVREDAFSLQYVFDWFLVLQETWYEDFDNDDVLIEWYHDYKKRKAQKAKIKEELLPIVGHPDRMRN